MSCGCGKPTPRGRATCLACSTGACGAPPTTGVPLNATPASPPQSPPMRVECDPRTLTPTQLLCVPTRPGVPCCEIEQNRVWLCRGILVTTSGTVGGVGDPWEAYNASAAGDATAHVFLPAILGKYCLESLDITIDGTAYEGQVEVRWAEIVVAKNPDGTWVEVMQPPGARQGARLRVTDGRCECGPPLCACSYVVGVNQQSLGYRLVLIFPTGTLPLGAVLSVQTTQTFEEFNEDGTPTCCCYEPGDICGRAEFVRTCIGSTDLLPLSLGSEEPDWCPPAGP